MLGSENGGRVSCALARVVQAIRTHRIKPAKGTLACRVLTRGMLMSTVVLFVAGQSDLEVIVARTLLSKLVKADTSLVGRWSK